jgi:hypothetical protein
VGFLDNNWIPTVRIPPKSLRFCMAKSSHQQPKRPSIPTKHRNEVPSRHSIHLIVPTKQSKVLQDKRRCQAISRRKRVSRIMVTQGGSLFCCLDCFRPEIDSVFLGGVARFCSSQPPLTESQIRVLQHFSTTSSGRERDLAHLIAVRVWKALAFMIAQKLHCRKGPPTSKNHNRNNAAHAQASYFLVTYYKATRMANQNENPRSVLQPNRQH